MTARRRIATLAIRLAVGWAAVAVPAPVSAQGLNLGGAGGDTPIEVYADNGIEWQQDNLLFVARGDARAIRNGVEVLGDELRAYYRKTTAGDTEIWRLDAHGNVRIISASDTAYGDRAIYNADQQVLVIDGKAPRLISGEDTLTAEKQLEYWEARQFAVARGNAVAVREQKRVRADVLVAHFRQDKTGANKVYRVDAYDNVFIKTATDTATGSRGVYNVESGIATLTGSVKLIREDNELQGCRAEVNLNTGISRMFSCSPEQGGKRVQGVLVPKKKNSE